MPSWTSLHSKGTHPGGAALAVRQGDPDQGKRERFHYLFQKHHFDPGLNMKESAPAYGANPAQHSSAQVRRESHLHGCWQHPPPWSFPTPPAPGCKHFASSIAPSRHEQGRRISQASPTCAPMLRHAAPSATTIHWTILGTILGLRVDGLTRLALSSYHPQCDQQARSVSPQAKHKHLIKMKPAVAGQHLPEVYMQLWGFFLALISVTVSQHNCTKNNALTSISDPEDIQNAKTQTYHFFLRYKFWFKNGCW